MTTRALRDTNPFRHEAFLYAGEEEFLARTTAFIEDGVRRGEAVLVMVPGDRMAALRSSTAADDEAVRFADMEVVGRNPARVIPAWLDFVEEFRGHASGLRGIGEPAWPGRAPAELAECHRQESLLNMAFAEVSDFWLLCPYDITGLAAGAIEHAGRTHPYLLDGDVHGASSDYDGWDAATAPFAEPLSAVPAEAVALSFCADDLRQVRQVVRGYVDNCGLRPDQADDVVLSVTEAVTNSVRHGGGSGSLALWHDDDALVCEVQDAGYVTDPLAGRRRPSLRADAGRGLWVINQLCDLVQLRSSPDGTTLRLRFRRT